MTSQKFLTPHRKSMLLQGYDYHLTQVARSKGKWFQITEKTFRAFARSWIADTKDRDARYAAEIAGHESRRAALIAEVGPEAAHIITDIQSLDMANVHDTANRAERARLAAQLGEMA